MAKSIDGIQPRRPSSDSAPRQTPSKRVSARWKWIALIFAGVVVVGGAAVGALVIVGNKNTSVKSGSDLASVESNISRHYVLPTDEVPALATVTDKSKLTTPFLKMAENGDQLLIYPKNHLAVIYRPSIDRIVSTGPVSVDDPPASLKSQSGN